MTAHSLVIDNGKTRTVAVVESPRTVNLYATKYGDRTSSLVRATLSADEAYALGLFLVQHVKPNKEKENDE